MERMAALMQTHTTNNMSSHTPRRLAPAGGALLGACVCAAAARPSFWAGTLAGGQRAPGGTGMRGGIRVALRARQGMFADYGSGLATGPIMAQGHGRSAPIARRC